MIVFNNVDVCKFYESPNILFDYLLTSCHKYIPELCHPCPLTPFSVAYNLTSINHDCPDSQNSKNPAMGTINFWPDGDYKTEIKLMVSDPEPASLKIVYIFKKYTGNKNKF